MIKPNGEAIFKGTLVNAYTQQTQDIYFEPDSNSGNFIAEWPKDFALSGNYILNNARKHSANVGTDIL